MCAWRLLNKYGGPQKDYVVRQQEVELAQAETGGGYGGGDVGGAEAPTGVSYPTLAARIAAGIAWHARAQAVLPVSLLAARVLRGRGGRGRCAVLQQSCLWTRHICTWRMTPTSSCAPCRRSLETVRAARAVHIECHVLHATAQRLDAAQLAADLQRRMDGALREQRFSPEEAAWLGAEGPAWLPRVPGAAMRCGQRARRVRRARTPPPIDEHRARMRAAMGQLQRVGSRATGAAATAAASSGGAAVARRAALTAGRAAAAFIVDARKDKEGAALRELR
ncbi:hypothetical protein JKP88DRAFT_247551 [Tribonema minus]|uniref:Uncharacterized protein n=1 Tax=Tribonema minus TaxID=303371 RepID=A0A835YRK2_9STRA|nr:hypothetical protein JKP88DRAFT_247551 [Tribonema minus]